MPTSQIRTSFEDFCTALILGGLHSQSKNKLAISINQDRVEIFTYYLQIYKISYEIQQSASNNSFTFEFEASFTFKRLLNEWTNKGSIDTISPRLLNIHVYLLWICLFCEKRKNYIRISNMHFSDCAKNTFMNIFKRQMGITIRCNSIQFIIHDIISVILMAIHTKREMVEIHLLTKFLPSEKEYMKLVSVFNSNYLTIREGRF